MQDLCLYKELYSGEAAVNHLCSNIMAITDADIKYKDVDLNANVDMLGVIAEGEVVSQTQATGSGAISLFLEFSGKLSELVPEVCRDKGNVALADKRGNATENINVFMCTEVVAPILVFDEKQQICKDNI